MSNAEDDTAVSRRKLAAGVGLALTAISGVGYWEYVNTVAEGTAEGMEENWQPLPTENTPSEGWTVRRGDCADQFEQPLELTFVPTHGGGNVTAEVYFRETFSPNLVEGQEYEIVVDDAEGDRTHLGLYEYRGKNETLILAGCA